MKKIYTIIQRSTNPTFYIYYIVIIAFLVRACYNFGHIFSDDAYYTYLSKTLYDLQFAKDYIGYPILPLRINMYILTSFAFFIFGTNEFATIVFPLLFSLANIVLIYKLTLLLSKNQSCSVLAALLLAFFPVDIIFASINFVDTRSVFFINLGIYFLFLAFDKKKIKYSFYSGIAYFISLQFKVNVFFPALLLVVLWLYLFFKYKKNTMYILPPIFFIIMNILIEGMIYSALYNDFLYRFHVLEQNYLFCKNDFFTLGSALGYQYGDQYFPALFRTIFMINFKTIFLRRLHLFLPLIALFQSIHFMRIRKNVLLAYWFTGLSLLFLAFTISFQEYRPMVLIFSHYITPLFVPAIILSAIFINRFKNKIKIGLYILYLACCIIMLNQYQTSIDKKGLSQFKSFLRSNPEKVIYADHYTKYSIDLIDGYPEHLRTIRITFTDLDFYRINAGEWIVYNPAHIGELESQGFQFPDYSVLKTDKFKLVFKGAKFAVYEKL